MGGIYVFTHGLYHFSKELFKYFYHYYHTKQLKNKIKEQYLIKVFLVNTFFIVICILLDKVFIEILIDAYSKN